MAPLRLLARRPLCSPGFTHKLLVELEISKRFRPEEILYLTPNKRRARRAEFEILSLYSSQEALQVPTCLTLQTLVESLVRAGAQKGIVDERDRRFILLKLIHESGNLMFREEHLGLLSGLYAELKRHRPDNWDGIPQKARELIFDTDTSLRLKQALDILEFYEKYLDQKNLVDHEGLYAEALADIPALSQKLLIVEGYFEPWSAEEKLFDALFKKIPEIVVIIPEHSLAARGEKFFLSHNLSQHPAGEPQAMPSSLWQRFPSREEEVKAIARRICALIKEKETLYPDEIIVTFPFSLETYRPIVERVFARYGIKVQVSLRPRLESFPCIRLVLDLLHTAEQGFPRREMVALLLSPGFKNVPESVRHWVDVLSRDEGIVASERSWKDWFLSDIPWKLKEQPQSAKLVNEIKGFVKEFVESLKTLARPSSVNDFGKRLHEVLARLGWEPDEVIKQGFEEIMEKFIRMTELAGQDVISPRFARETLEILLKREIGKPDTEEDEDGAVKVMPLVETRWLETRYLFVAGLIDGEFPRHPSRDILLPERLRVDLGLPTIEYEFNNARFEYERLLAMPKEGLFLSAPLMENDRPLLSSVFLAERKEDPKSDDRTVYCEEERQGYEPLNRDKLQEGVIFQDSRPLEIIGKRFGPKHNFRVTLLETYRNCPYRYYLREVLGLEPFEEPTPEPEARLLGTIMHSVLEELFKSEPDPETIDEKLWDFLLVELNSGRLNPFVRLWIEDWVKARKDWFRDLETARAEVGWRVDPDWLERSLELFFEKEGFTLKGRVDRVDWNRGRARVIDYKTGKERTFKLELRKGESIQLPLYCEMIRRLHGAEIDSFGIYAFLDSRMEEIPSPSQEMSAAVGFAEEAVTGIRKGFFEARKNKMCMFCEYNEFS